MKFEGTHDYDVEYHTVGLDDGIERWCSAKGKAYFGVAIRFIGTIRDISKLKNAEAQQKLLTHELEHRVKDTMAVISAIAAQTFRSAPANKAAQATFAARLEAFNAAHDLLSSWTTAPMMIVAEGALAPYRTGEDRIRIGGPAVILPANHAMSFALALHELATNATKYGALSVPGGRSM